MIRSLAYEQLAGQLKIAPRSVNSSSEVLTGEARAAATRAWNIAPFNVYAATETGGIAAECDQHRGMHLFEDLVIPEVVDDDYNPVSLGEPGSRLLVTVLFSRTVPLLVASPAPGFNAATTEREVQVALGAVGVLAPVVHLSVVDTIPAGPAGKRPFVVASPTP